MDDEETDDEIAEDEAEDQEDEAEGGSKEIWTIYEGGENKDGLPAVENLDGEENEEEKKQAPSQQADEEEKKSGMLDPD